MPDCVHAWLAIVPSLFSVAPAHPDALAAHVDGGNHLMVSFFSGIAGSDGAVHTGGYPGACRDVLGAGVRPVVDDAPPGVEAVRRGDALVLLDHGTEPAGVVRPGDTVTIGPRDVVVLDA